MNTLTCYLVQNKQKMKSAKPIAIVLSVLDFGNVLLLIVLKIFAFSVFDNNFELTSTASRIFFCRLFACSDRFFQKKRLKLLKNVFNKR